MLKKVESTKRTENREGTYGFQCFFIINFFYVSYDTYLNFFYFYLVIVISTLIIDMICVSNEKF